jgi:hypothetical protein
MCFFTASATFEAYQQFYLEGAIIYSIALALIFFLAIFSVVKTFITHPGKVTDDLIKRLKS